MARCRVVVGALIALLVVAFLVASVIDPNRYEGFVADRVKAATGRAVELQG